VSAAKQHPFPSSNDACTAQPLSAGGGSGASNSTATVQLFVFGGLLYWHNWQCFTMESILAEHCRMQRYLQKQDATMSAVACNQQQLFLSFHGKCICCCVFNA
jgi:hypothetical protein